MDLTLRSSWDAVDQFRANSGLKPQKYSGLNLVETRGDELFSAWICP